MNYQKIHDAIINRARGRILTGYKERHHIIPKCMGGTDDITNLVNLTAREHYIVHKLLVEIYPNHHGIFKGYYAMSLLKQNNREIVITSREYNYLREEFSKRNTGELNHFYGKNHTLESKEKMKKNSKRKGVPPWCHGLTKETHPGLKKISETRRWNDGLTKEDPRIQRQISNSIKSRTGKCRGKYKLEYITCPHCNVTHCKSEINKRHMDKCKYKL
jgi:hypothetical protein